MQLRNFAPTTQRSYVRYVAEFALYFHRSPELLDLELCRQLLATACTALLPSLSAQEPRRCPRCGVGILAYVLFLRRGVWTAHEGPSSEPAITPTLPVCPEAFAIRSGGFR